MFRYFSVFVYHVKNRIHNFYVLRMNQCNTTPCLVNHLCVFGLKSSRFVFR